MTKLIIFSLFDRTGLALIPWARGGHECYAFDINADEGYRNGINFITFDLSAPLGHPGRAIKDMADFMGGEKPDAILSWPPCTDLTVAEAKHFAAKAQKDPFFQEKAAQMFHTGRRMGLFYKCPVFTENPVGVMSTRFRQPDFYFHPADFGGYLPDKDRNPIAPEIYPPRDAYKKLSCGWCENGFIAPDKKPVSVISQDNPGWKKLGGKGERTKFLRSLTPRGLAVALYRANKGALLKRATIRIR